MYGDELVWKEIGRKMMKDLKMTCRDATYLYEKKKEGKITISERIGLWWHLIICKFCSLFFMQMEKLEKSARNLPDKTATSTTLNPDSKRKLQSDFNKLLGEQ